jgi:hypothetical protein
MAERIHEGYILHARQLLEKMDEKSAVDTLVAGGCQPELSFLAIKAAGILRAPYVYKEAEGRIVDPSAL